MEKKKETDQCCGGCTWFLYEDTEGMGLCLRKHADHYSDGVCHCGDGAKCRRYVSCEQRDAYIQILRGHAPADSVDEIGNAMRFAADFIELHK